ncbi:hypothetical protein HRG_011250 [Hirsutella rhossiliensis]
MAMTIPSSSRIFQQIEDIQIRISQCEQELKSHKSPRFEYEERLTDVNTRIDEAWERLFSGQSPIDRSELQSKILNYGLYLAFKSDAWSPVLLLPTDNLHDVGLPITIEALGLTKNVPHCYEYDREEKSFRWRKEYEGGGRLFAERQYPIIFFDCLDFPERSSVGWVAARDLRSFDLMDANIDKRIKHVGQVRQFVNEREKSRAKDKDDASASQRARSVDGDDTRSLGLSV